MKNKKIIRSILMKKVARKDLFLKKADTNREVDFLSAQIFGSVLTKNNLRLFRAKLSG